MHRSLPLATTFTLALLTLGCGSSPTAPTKLPICTNVVTVPAHDVCELIYFYPQYALVCHTVPAVTQEVCK